MNNSIFTPSTPHYVYIINQEDLQNNKLVCKIGYTKDANQRIKGLQTGSDKKLRVFQTFLVAYNRYDANKIERQIQKMFTQFKREGEWFAFDPVHMVTTVLPQIEKFVNDLDVKDEPLPILVNNNELLKIINNEGLFNTVVEVELDKKTENVVFKEVQKHPSKNIFTHIDLQRVVEGTKVNVVVPVLLKNQDKCFGVKIEGGVINHVLKEISVLANPESIPESIEVDMEEIKSKEKVRLSSLSENSDYDFPSSLKNQDPVLVSVLTARGGGLDFEDEEVDDVEEGAEAESTEASDEKSSEETNSDNSEGKSE